MSGWGIKDAKTASGTVGITTGGAVTGSSTAFTTEAAVGDFLRVSSQEFIIISIADDQTATVINANPQTTWTTVSAGASYTLSEKPTSLASDPSILSTNVFGVDTSETAATSAEGKPVAHAGWVLKKTVGSRTIYETLVALSKNGASPANMGDYEDVEFEDAFIAITTQPDTTAEADAGDAIAVLASVVATIAPSTATIAYQWQHSVDGGANFSNINPAGGVFTGADSDTLGVNAGMTDTSSTWNNAQFRCVLTSSGADTVTSDALRLTVNP